MAKRMQHCFYCGEELGVYDSFYGDLEACGKLECQRELRYTHRQQEAEAREAAERDDYSRYR